MIYIRTKAKFANTTTQSTDEYTLLGRSDIPPFLIYSNPLAPSNMADGLLPRAINYQHISHILPGPFNHISYPNNGWAWVYDSNNQEMNLPSPCYYDILAESNSNGLNALAHLIKFIGRFSGTNSADLPNQIELFGMFKYNNTDYTLYILATYNPTQNQTTAHYLYAAPFDASLPRITTNNILQSSATNIFEYVSHLIDTFQQNYKTKVKIFNANISDDLTVQPI